MNPKARQNYKKIPGISQANYPRKLSTDTEPCKKQKKNAPSKVVSSPKLYFHGESNGVTLPLSQEAPLIFEALLIIVYL